MNLKRFYDDSSVGSAENLVARAVPLSTVFCRRNHDAPGAADSPAAADPAELAADGPYHHRSRIDGRRQQPPQQQCRRHAAELRRPDFGTPPVRCAGTAKQQRRTDMTSQQRIERMSRIMKQQNHRPEQTIAARQLRHATTLVSQCFRPVRWTYAVREFVDRRPITARRSSSGSVRRASRLSNVTFKMSFERKRKM